MKRLFNPLGRWPFIAGVTLLWLLLFESAGRLSQAWGHFDPRLPFDHALPFWPAAIWPYLSAYLLPFLAGWLIRDERSLSRFAISILLATLVALPFYLFLPCAWAPPVLGDSFSEKALALQLALDFKPGANKVPALHATLPFLLYFFVQGREGPLKSWPLLAWALASAASSLLIRQHALVDLVAGLLLAAFSYRCSGWLAPLLEAGAKDPFKARAAIVRRGAGLAAYIAVFWVALPWALYLLARLLNRAWPLYWLQHPGFLYLGIALLALGAVLCFGASWQLMRMGKGFPASHFPPQKMQTSLCYRFSAHPIYAGFTLALTGAFFALGSAWGLLVVVPVFWISWNCYVKFFEEPSAIERWGRPYRSYLESRTGKPGSSAGFTYLKNFFQALADRPIAWGRGRHVLAWFGVWIALGALMWMHLAAAMLAAQGASPESLARLVLGMSLAAVGGAWAFWKLGNPKARGVGFVSFGTIAACLPLLFVFAWRQGLPALGVLDAAFAGAMAAYIPGRLGCTSYGCCYGRHCKGWGWEIRHPESKAVREHGRVAGPRFPTTAMGAATGLLLLALSLLLASQKAPSGLIAGLGSFLYGCFRFATEFFRDRPRHWKLFSSGQAGALALTAAGIAVLSQVAPGATASLPNALAWQASLGLAQITVPLAILIMLAQGYHRDGLGRGWR